MHGPGNKIGAREMRRRVETLQNFFSFFKISGNILGIPIMLPQKVKFEKNFCKKFSAEKGASAPLSNPFLSGVHPLEIVCSYNNQTH